MCFSRKHATEEQIYNNSAKCWGVFKEVIDDKMLPRDERDIKLNCLFEKMVDLTEPERIVERRVGFFSTILQKPTMDWRNKMNFLRKIKIERPDDLYIRKAFNEASKYFHKLAKMDQIATITETHGVEFISDLEFFKVNQRLNKDKTKLSECPLSVDEIADGFNKLQWENEIQIDKRVFRLEKCSSNENNYPQFHFNKVVWEGKNRRFSLVAALKSCKNNSRGRSGLTKRFLSCCTPNYRKVMLDLVNNSLTKGLYHEAWKTSRVTPIPKKGRDPKTIKAWRPISVGDLVGTVCEKVAASQFQAYLEKYKLIHRNQHGFRSAHSCSTAITEMTNVMKNYKNFKYVVSIMVDCKNALGSPSHIAILESVYNFMATSTFSWFESFLENRAFYVQKGDKRSTIRNLPY